MAVLLFLQTLRKYVSLYANVNRKKGVDRMTTKEMMQDYMRGFHQQGEKYYCLYCKEQTEIGCIYPDEEKFFTAEKFMQRHIEAVHEGPLMALLQLPKETTGISETQQEIITLFARKIDDKFIAQRLGVTASAVRNHRFKLKEKQKQAQVFLSIMALLAEPEVILPHSNAKMLDDRYNITPEEQQKVLTTYRDEKGFIKTFPAKEKRKLILLADIVRHFEFDKNYHESALNAILKQYVADFVTVRRYLIEYGFMQRTKDGSSYWREK